MLHYSCTGPKSAGIGIVFLHGAGFSGWMWENIIGHLPDFFCVAITLPGHGLSAKIPWVSLPETARQVDEIIDKEMTGMDVHLVGLSLGGHIALHLLSRRPHLIKTATLSCIIHDPLPILKTYRLFSKIMIPFSGLRVLQKFVARKFGMVGEQVRRYLQENRKIDKASVRRASTEVAKYPLADNMADTSARVLLIAGETERSITRNAMGKFKNEFAHARCAIVKGFGYGWSGRRPSLFAKAIRAQIKGVSLPEDMQEI